MKPRLGDIFMWLVKLSFLLALTYAASDIPERQDDARADDSEKTSSETP
jgi:hypothetical protein